MGRRFQIILTSLLLFLTVISMAPSYKENAVPVDKITSENSSSSTTTTTNNTTTLEEFVSTIESTEIVTTEQDPLETITFENGVSINNYIPFQNGYLAIGDEDNTPYMQVIDLNNQEVIKGAPYKYADGNGKIIDVSTNEYYVTTTIDNDNTIYTQDFITYNGSFIPFFKKQIQYNYNKGLIIEPEYLVIHETANTSVGADANAHYRYWNNNPTAYASTHFVVDNHEIYQMLELNQSAWHVGDNDDNHSDITNVNSIGIEVAVNADGDFSVARQNVIDLTINLMKTLNMDISQLKRHYDASGKYCPTNMLQRPDLWNDFVEQVKIGLSK